MQEPHLVSRPVRFFAFVTESASKRLDFGSVKEQLHRGLRRIETAARTVHHVNREFGSKRLNTVTDDVAEKLMRDNRALHRA